MIKLSPAYTTTIQTLAGSTVTGSTVTDTLFVTEVRLDFTTGTIYAVIQRGTVAGSGFISNYPTVGITVNPDGSFTATDGSWTGSLGASVATLTSALKSQFDSFILNSGLVTGTAE